MNEVAELERSDTTDALDRLLVMLQDPAQVVSVRDRATFATIRQGAGHDRRRRSVSADAALFGVAASSDRSDRARLWAMRHLVDRWIDDQDNEHGSRVVAWSAAESEEGQPNGARRLAKDAVRHVLSRRPDRLDAVQGHANPVVAQLAKAEAARWRRLDPSMTFQELAIAMERRDYIEVFAKQAVRTETDFLRIVRSRREESIGDRAMGNTPAGVAKRLEAARARLADVQRMTMIEVVAAAIDDYEAALEEAAAGEERGQKRVNDAERGRPPTRLSLSWMASSVFMTESGRMESTSWDEGFSITLPGRAPQELTDEQVAKLKAPDSEHQRALVLIQRGENWLSQFSEQTKARAKEVLRQSQIDAMLEAQRERERKGRR